MPCLNPPSMDTHPSGVRWSRTSTTISCENGLSRPAGSTLILLRCRARMVAVSMISAVKVGTKVSPLPAQSSTCLSLLQGHRPHLLSGSVGAGRVERRRVKSTTPIMMMVIQQIKIYTKMSKSSDNKIYTVSNNKNMYNICSDKIQ